VKNRTTTDREPGAMYEKPQLPLPTGVKRKSNTSKDLRKTVYERNETNDKRKGGHRGIEKNSGSREWEIRSEEGVNSEGGRRSSAQINGTRRK